MVDYSSKTNLPVLNYSKDDDQQQIREVKKEDKVLECVLCATGTSPKFTSQQELEKHIFQHDVDYESEGTLQDEEALDIFKPFDECPHCNCKIANGIIGMKLHVANRQCLKHNRRQVMNTRFIEARPCPDDHIIEKSIFYIEGGGSDTGENGLLAGMSDAQAKRHLEIAQLPLKRWTCCSCPMSFNRRCELRRHELEVHEQYRPHRCTYPDCSKSFTRNDALVKHIQVVHEGQRRYHCKECPERFSSNYDLKRHVVRAHDGYRPFPCEFCSAGFTQKSQLTMHKTRSHRFVCKECQGISWGEQNYQEHLRTCSLVNRGGDTEMVTDDNVKKENVLPRNMIPAAV